MVNFNRQNVADPRTGAKKVRRRSMRSRMTAAFAVFVGCLMLAGSAAVQKRERQRVETRSRELLDMASSEAKAELVEGENEGIDLLHVAMVNKAEIGVGGLTLAVFDSKGQLLWQSKSPAPQWHSASPDWRVKTLSYKGQTLVMARSWAPIEADLRETLGMLLALSSIVVGATAIGAWYTVGKTLYPIEQLAKQAAAASTERLEVQLEAPSPDAEMMRLATTLNGLLERLAHDAAAQGRFYAAASHELRTPLQGLLGHLDVALSRPREAHEYEGALREAQSQTERLTTLIQDLLQLNALETGATVPPVAPTNVADLLERTLTHLTPLANQRDLQLTTELPDMEIEVPPAHLEMVLRNLLENALKYAKPGGEVRVGVEEVETDDGAQTRIWVHNECDLPSNSCVQSWFEPFFRPDASRQSATGGNGLGLAIVRAVSLTNGWKIGLVQHENGVLASVQMDCIARRPYASAVGVG